MATSGSYDYSVTALNVITDAAENIGIIANGQSLDSNDLATMLRALNMQVKQWQGTSDKFPGLKAWTRHRISVYFASNQGRYLIGPASTDDRAADTRTPTTLTAAKALAANTIFVASTTGISVNDAIGIQQSAGGIGWAVVLEVVSSVELTIGVNTIPATAAGAMVFSYTTKSQRFVDIESASLRDWSNTSQPIDIPIEIFTDVQQYEQITQKHASGDPTAILVEYSRLNTVVTTNFYPANFYKTLRLTVLFPSEDYDSATGADDIAYPQEYFAALSWELSRRCAPKFGRAWTQDMQTHWQIAVQEGVNFAPQDTHLYFEPGREETDTGSPFTRP